MLNAINLFVGLFTIGCFFVVLFKMWEEGHQILALVCFFFCGFGGLIAFVYGWVHARQWEITPIMIGWSACIGINVLLSLMIGGG